jgi:hypothetical protein
MLPPDDKSHHMEGHLRRLANDAPMQNQAGQDDIPLIAEFTHIYISAVSAPV